MISNQVIKNLANESIDSKGQVDVKIANYVLQKFNKKELKIFLRRLKKTHMERSVIIKFDGNMTNEIKKEIENMYKNKTVSYEKDEKLGGGIIILDNDMTVNYTMSGMIEDRLHLI